MAKLGAGPHVLPPEVLTPAAVRTWVHGAMDLLTLARPVIDRANVFPVADADTGTNMWLTLGQARETVDALAHGADVDAVLHALAEGALLGARGNSGVILSEYLRGFATGARSAGAQPASSVVVAALQAGARCAYDAVGHPRQGTILSAAAGAATAAQAAHDTGADLVTVVRAARTGAHDALRRSADDLDVLRAAGVLDAGAYGLALVLDALCRALGGEDAVSVAPGTMTPMTVMTTLTVGPSGAGAACAATTRPVDEVPVDGEFEVMYVVEHTGDGAQHGGASVDGVARVLRGELGAIGDSVAVVGGPTGAGSHGLWQVHVHTDRPLDALRAGRRWTQRQVVVRSLVQQVARAAAADRGGHGAVGIVACTASPGLVTELARAGAVVVLRGTVPVATSDLRRAVEETGAPEVVLVPADAATVDVARAWVGDDGSAVPRAAGGAHVRVLESVSDLHAVAAMVRWATTAPEVTTEDLVASLRATIESVRTVELDATDAAEVRAAALAELLAPRPTSGRSDDVAPPATVLTIVADDLVPPEVVGDIERAAQHLVPGIEVVGLSSGRQAPQVLLGAE